MARTYEQMLKAKRISMARARAENPAKFRKRGRDRYSANPEIEKAKMRAYYGRRFFWGRAMKLRGPERATTIEVARMWKRQRGRCALTGERMDRTAQLDHIVPKARGGDDSIGNLRWVTEAANIAKRHMTDAEFLALCRSVASWIGERIALVDG